MKKVIQEQNEKLEQQKNKMLIFSSKLQLTRITSEDFAY